MSKYVPFCPLCLKYETHEDHKRRCLIGQLKAEIEELRIDAERYRWLRSEHNPPSGPFYWSSIKDYNSKWDSAIDYAMKRAKND